MSRFSPSGLRSTATRVTFGATSLSVCSHLPPIAGSKFAKPVRLPPGLLRLATTPAPSGSEIPTKTVGIDCVAWRTAASTDVPRDKNDLGCRSDERGSVRSEAFRIGGGKVIIDMNVAAFDPAQCRPRGFERFNARLRIKVGHEHADPANAAGLLRARRPEAKRRRAAENTEKVPPSHIIPCSFALGAGELHHRGPFRQLVFQERLELLRRAGFRQRLEAGEGGLDLRRVFSPSLMTALSLATICGGVPFGAMTPVQASMVKSG